MNKVTIKNLRIEKPKYEWQIRVDRSSVLGNPYFMKDELQRDNVCDMYENYFKEKIKNQNGAFYKEVKRLYEIKKKYGKLELFCWCYPKRCHAETIAKFLENI